MADTQLQIVITAAGDSASQVLSDLSTKITQVTSTSNEASAAAEGAGTAITEMGAHAEASEPLLVKMAGSLESLSFKAWGIQQLGGMVKELGEQFLGDAPEFEQWSQQFTVFLGSADAAKQRMADLAAFGTKVPFQLPSVVEADKTLTAFGLDSETTAQKFGVSGASILKTVADAAAGSGADLTRISDDFGRFAGGMSGMAIQDFEQMGITTRSQLADMGLQFSKAGELLTPVDKAFAVLQKTVENRFGGMTDVESTTMKGMMTDVADSINNMRRDLTAPIFDAVRLQVKALMDDLANPASTKNIGTIVGAFTDFAANIIPVVASFIGAIFKNLGDAGGVISGFAQSMGGLAAVVQEFASSVGDATGGTGTFTDVLAKAALAYGAYELGVKAATIATDLWGKTTALAGGVAALFGPILESMVVAFQLVTEGEGLATAASLVLDAAWAASPVGVIIAIGAAAAGLVLGFKALYDNVQPVHDAINGLWDSLSKNPFGLVEGAINNLLGPIGQLLQGLLGLVGMIPGMGDKVKGLETAISSLGQTVEDRANTALAGAGKAIGDVASATGTAVSAIGSHAQAAVAAAASIKGENDAIAANTKAKQDNVVATANAADGEKAWTDLIKQTEAEVKSESDAQKQAATDTYNSAVKSIDATDKAAQDSIDKQKKSFDDGMDAQTKARQNKLQTDQQALSREEENTNYSNQQQVKDYDQGMQDQVKALQDASTAKSAIISTEKQENDDTLASELQTAKDTYQKQADAAAAEKTQIEATIKQEEQDRENQVNAQIEGINREKQAFDDNIAHEKQALADALQQQTSQLDDASKAKIADLQAQKTDITKEDTYRTQEADLTKRAGDTAGKLLLAYHDALDAGNLPLADKLSDQISQIDDQAKALMHSDQIARQQQALDDQIKSIQDQTAAQKQGLQDQNQAASRALDNQKQAYDESVQYQLQGIQDGLTAFKQAEAAKQTSEEATVAKTLKDQKAVLDQVTKDNAAQKKADDAKYADDDAKQKADTKNQIDNLNKVKQEKDREFENRQEKTKLEFEDRKQAIADAAAADLDALGATKKTSDDDFDARKKDSTAWATQAKSDAKDTQTQATADIDAIAADHQSKLEAMGADWDTWKSKGLDSISQVKSAMDDYISETQQKMQVMQEATGKGSLTGTGNAGGSGTGGPSIFGSDPGGPPADPGTLGAKVVAATQSWLDSYAYGSGSETFCERFVANMEGRPVQSTAFAAFQKRSADGQIQSGGTPPAGAEIFFAPDAANEGMGHTGISLGNGMFRSVTVDGIRDYSISDWSSNSWGAPYLGWVPAGTPMYLSGGQMQNDGLAYLHAGEFIVSQQTSQRLSNSGLSYGDLQGHLDSLTSGSPGGGGGMIVVNVNVHDNNFGSGQDPQSLGRSIAMEVSRELGNRARRQGLTRKGVTIPG